MTIRKHTNNAATTLDGAITNIATSMTVVAASDFPDISANGEYNLTIDTGVNVEIVTVTSVAGLVLTITRGAESTSNIAHADLVDVRLLTTADSHDRKCDLASVEAVDFSGAGSFKVPVSATPTVAASGEIALDTTITDHTGLLTYYDSVEALYVVALPTANLLVTDGYVIAYNATNNEFEMVAAAAGGLANVVEDTTPQLGGALDVNGKQITSVGGTDIEVHSDNDVNVILGDAGGVDDFNIKDSGDVIVAGIDSDGNITTSGTVDGRDVATDGTKLDGVEAAADVTDEANVTTALDGATLGAVTVAVDDKVIIQDTSGSDAIKTVTTQAIADLAPGGGSVLQTIQTVDVVNRSTASTSFVTSNVTASITPSSTSSKILITYHGITGASAAAHVTLTMFRDSTDLTPAGVAGMLDIRITTDLDTLASSFSYLDSPATTSAIVYSVRFLTTSGTVYLGRRGNDTVFDSPSILTVQEILE